MLVKLRENLYLGDKDAYTSGEELKEKGITSVVIVADDLPPQTLLSNQSPKVWLLGLRADRMNPPHAKDLVAHTVKYSLQNGETVLVQSVTGLQRGAYVACRVLCELEQITIYEVMQQVKETIPEFDINKSYF